MVFRNLKIVRLPRSWLSVMCGVQIMKIVRLPRSWLSVMCGVQIMKIESLLERLAKFDMR